MKPFSPKIYDFDTIKAQVSISRYLEDRGVTIKSNRFPAVWRGSEDLNCAIGNDDKVWCDHVTKEGGSVIDLCMRVEGINLPFLAATHLGETYHLQPKVGQLKVIPPTDGSPMSRFAELRTKGWNHVATYSYTDEDGNELYSVLRLENPKTHEKTFLQRTPDHWGLENVRRVLYNLPRVIAEDTICIVEGEKDADTLTKLGICTTTNNGGAKNWSQDFNRFFQGKNVIVFADNDEAGQEHAKLIVREINDIVSSLKVVTPSKLPKGDVTDFFEKEGRTLDELSKIVEDTPYHDRKATSAANAQYTIDEARLLNAEPFRNFVLTEVLDKKGKVKEVEEPIKINDLCLECRRRFLDFPRRMSGVLFDRNLKTGEIKYISSPDSLFAWIALTSRQPVEWTKARGAVSHAQFFQALMLSVKNYEGISRAPHWPLRPEIFYINKPLPQLSSEEPSALEDLVNRFSPAKPIYKTLIRAFIMSPMYYSASAPRPAWVIDSVDGKGVGKTTLVKLLAECYEESPIDIDTTAIKNDITSIVKRLISSDGRSKRICLLDNVQGSFRSPNLARLITATSVSGIAPYGRGEETRVNDLTYIITSNAASLDDDLAQRTYTIKLKRSVRAVSWEGDVRKHINANRERIYAEIIDRLAHPKVQITTSKTRYPEFERAVLCAACSSEEEYNEVVATIASDTDAANVTTDRAQEAEEVFRDAIAGVLRSYPGASERPTFLNTAAISHIIAGSETLRLEGIRKGEIEEMIQSGNLTSCFAKAVRVVTINNKSIRGRLWTQGFEVYAGVPTYVNLIEVEKDHLVYRGADQKTFREV